MRQGGEGDAGPDWARSGARAGGVKKKKKEMGWAEREIEEERFSIFQNDSNTFKINSNSKI